MLVLHGEGSKRPATAVTVLMIELSLLASFYGILLYKSTAVSAFQEDDVMLMGSLKIFFTFTLLRGSMAPEMQSL